MSISANELRIGNKVYWGIKVVEIKGIHTQFITPSRQQEHFYVSDFVSFTTYYAANPSDLSPIPLTTEILTGWCGFTKYEWMNGCFIKTKFGDFMVQFLEGKIISYFTNVGADKHGMKMRDRKYVGNINTTENIKYLHQLQNLIHALTSKELEIKLPID